MQGMDDEDASRKERIKDCKITRKLIRTSIFISSSSPPVANSSSNQCPACVENNATNLDTLDGWKICFVSFLAGFICFGIQCSFGSFHRVLVSRFQEGSAFTAWLGSLAFGATFFTSPFSNTLCETISPSQVSLIGVLLCIFGLFLSSFATNILSLYATYGLCFGIGASLAYFPTVVALKKYFKRHLTLANGLSASGSGLGTLALGPLIEYCLETIGLRWTYIVLCVLAATMLLTQIMFSYTEGKIAKTELRCQRRNFMKNFKALIFQKDLWKDKKYLFMVLSIAVFLFGYFVPYVHLVYLATTNGVPTIKAALLISYLSISSTAGKIFFGFLINFTGIRVRTVTACTMLCIGLSNIYIPFGNSYLSLCVYVILIGLSEGCFTGQIATIVLETVGSDRMPQGLANLFAINAVFMMAGPPLAGLIYDKTKSYDMAFFIAGGTSSLGALLMFLLSILDRKNSSSCCAKMYYICCKKEEYFKIIRKSSAQSNGNCNEETNYGENRDFFLLKETNV